MLFASDLHIGEDKNQDERVQSILSDMKELYPDETLVLGGDTIDSPSKRQINKANKTLHGMYVIPLPGNHCVGPHGIWAMNYLYRRWHEDLAEKRCCLVTQEPIRGRGDRETYLEDYPLVWEQEGYLNIGLDTAGPVRALRWHVARGKVGTRQLMVLEHILGRANKPVNLFMHHHLREHRGSLELVDADRLRGVLVKSGLDIEVYMGHRHKPGRYSHLNIDVVATGKFVDDGPVRVRA